MARTRKTPAKPASPPLSQALQTPALIPIIVRVLTEVPYPKNDAKVVVSPQVRKSPLRESLTAAFTSAPQSDMGAMRVLPLEILHMICLSMDLQSCFNLRQANRQARCIVSALPQYHDLANYALECLKVVFRSRVARMVTVSDLYGVFCNSECMMCSQDTCNSGSRQTLSQFVGSGIKDASSSDGTVVRGTLSQPEKTKKVAKAEAPTPANEGAITVNQLQLQLLSNTEHKTDGMFLFLPTLTRCCRACLEESPRARAVPLCALIQASGLTAADFESVRIAAPLMKKSARISHIQARVLTGTASQRDAARVLLEKGKPPSEAKANLFQSGYFHEFAWIDELYERGSFTTIMPFMDRRAQKACRGYVCKGCDQAAEAIYGRFKANLQYVRPVYGTQARFLEHVAKCRDAMLLWGEHLAANATARILAT